MENLKGQGSTRPWHPPHPHPQTQLGKNKKLQLYGDPSLNTDNGEKINTDAFLLKFLSIFSEEKK